MWKNNKITSIGIDSESEIYTFSTSKDLIKLSSITDKIIPFGYGSNSIIWDKCILVRQTEKYSLREENGYIIVDASAGTELGKIVYDAIMQNADSEIAHLAGIPGTLGGAIVQNSGVFGHTVFDYLVSVTCWDNTKRCEVCLTNLECQPSHRSSIFIKEPSRYIILSASMRIPLDKTNNSEALYNIILSKRAQSFPSPYDEPSSGSLFLSCLPVEWEIAKLLPMDKITDMKNGQYRVSPGAIFDSLGLKGKFITGNLYLSEKHGNFLCNKGKATSEEWFEAVSKLAEIAEKKLGIKLFPEVNVIGNNIPSYVKALCRCREGYEI